MSRERCESCDRPATTEDVNGIPLCAGCYADLARETARVLDPEAE